MKIANPIYDIVFKYLMEDERIARTILSALLKVEGVKVEGHMSTVTISATRCRCSASILEPPCVTMRARKN